MQFHLQVITVLLIVNGASLLGSGDGSGTRSDLTSDAAAEKPTPAQKAATRAALLKKLHDKIDETKEIQEKRSSRRRGKLKNVTIGRSKSGQG